MMQGGGSRDPATPWFEAAQARVPDSPRGSLDKDHPIRSAIRRVAYPASRDQIAAIVTESQDVTPDQAAWLASSLPGDTYASEADVVDALWRWGAPPAAAEPSL